jgi:hypothetical protein
MRPDRNYCLASRRYKIQCLSDVMSPSPHLLALRIGVGTLRHIVATAITKI